MSDALREALDFWYRTDGCCEPERLESLLGGGWVAEEAAAIGLAAYDCSLTEKSGYSFDRAIRIAANHSGDSDSTASIAGQLAGAELGRDAIPGGWLDGLDCAAELSELGNGLL